MSDLKPCPFCGGRAEKEGHDDLPLGRVKCRNCQIHTMWYANIDDAASVWNTRADSAALAAAVQAEREAIIQFAEYAERVAREKSGEHWEGRSCASFAIANFVRSRGPAVVCQECNGERWHEYQNPLTGEITNRTPCAACNGAEEVPGPAPAVDARGIVREYVEAHAGLDNEFEIRSEESIAAETRFESAFAALRALVDGGLQS